MFISMYCKSCIICGNIQGSYKQIPGFKVQIVGQWRLIRQKYTDQAHSADEFIAHLQLIGA